MKSLKPYLSIRSLVKHQIFAQPGRPPGTHEPTIYMVPPACFFLDSDFFLACGVSRALFNVPVLDWSNEYINDQRAHASLGCHDSRRKWGYFSKVSAARSARIAPDRIISEKLHVPAMEHEVGRTRGTAFSTPIDKASPRKRTAPGAIHFINQFSRNVGSPHSALARQYPDSTAEDACSFCSCVHCPLKPCSTPKEAMAWIIWSTWPLMIAIPPAEIVSTW